MILNMKIRICYTRPQGGCDAFPLQSSSGRWKARLTLLVEHRLDTRRQYTQLSCQQFLWRNMICTKGLDARPLSAIHSENQHEAFLSLHHELYVSMLRVMSTTSFQREVGGHLRFLDLEKTGSTDTYGTHLEFKVSIARLDDYWARPQAEGNSPALPPVAPPETVATISTSFSFFLTLSTIASRRNAHISGRGYSGACHFENWKLSVLHLEIPLTAPRSLPFNIAT